MTIHFNELMIIGLCMLPGAFVVAFLLIWLLGLLGLEMEALIGAVPGVLVFIGGIVLLLLGIGQELH